MTTTAEPRMRGASPKPGQLTAHEIAVVTELARGGTYKQIGRRLDMSAVGVRAAVSRAKDRLGATTASHVVARAIGLRLIPAGIALTDTDRQVTR